MRSARDLHALYSTYVHRIQRTYNQEPRSGEGAYNSAYREIPRWPPFYVNSNCLIWHDPYEHRINSLNKSLVRMEPFQFTPAVLEELQKDSEAVEIHAHHYVNMVLYCNRILYWPLLYIPLKRLCVQLQ